jgi:GH24 family phage-related lysozyme (muramidase)
VSDLAEALIAEEEGREPCAYADSLTYLTIGIGCLVDKRVKGAGLCDAAIDAQFEHDSAVARADASALPGFSYANEVRQAVLISMCFQLGNLHDWPNFRKAVAVGDWEAAVEAGMDSAWYKIQTPERAKRELQMLASGQWIAK